MTRNCILSFCLSGHGFSGAVCLDGSIVAATSLERLTRVKNDILFPISKTDLDTFGWKQDAAVYKRNLDLPIDFEGDYSAVDFEKAEGFQRLLAYLLEAAGVSFEDVDCVAYSYRHVESARKYFLQRNPRIEFVVPEHHHSHACQAFLPSPFEEAAIMIVDGQGVPMERTGGDQLAGCLAYGQGTSIATLWEIPARQSLGGMYSAFTRRIGFDTNEEGKTMGLAPYGKDTYYRQLRPELAFDTFQVDPRALIEGRLRGALPKKVLYRLPAYGAFLKQFPRREKGEPIGDIHRDLAYAVQKLTEDVMIHLAQWLREKTGSKNLCIAGGVGLNCVANYQVLARAGFENIFVHPNAGDNGLAVGQALHVYSQLKGNSRRYVATTDSLGRTYSGADVQAAIAKVLAGNPQIEVTEYSDLGEMYDRMAAAIAAGNITSWFQGRSEFGPRALGNRSILADPRNPDMKDILNSRVKFRESFRPFTPSVLAEKSAEYFEMDVESPFMLLAPYVRPEKRKVIPAVTHEDNTARVQTVTRDVNERYYDLISAFGRLTGIPMVLDTSFNVAGEPIVETPEDAIRCFLSTDIDILCIDNVILKKNSKTH